MMRVHHNGERYSQRHQSIVVDFVLCVDIYESDDFVIHEDGDSFHVIHSRELVSALRYDCLVVRSGKCETSHRRRYEASCYAR
jgi:hypothetical protein